MIPSTTISIGPIDDVAPDSTLSAISHDLSVSLLHGVIASAYDPYVASVTPLAPANALGEELQMRATSSLRDVLLGQGWEVEDLNGLPSVASEKDGVRIECLTSRDPRVGVSGGSGPKLRARGPQGLAFCGCDEAETMVIPGMEVYRSPEEIARHDDLDFYFFLLRLDENAGEVRSELSAPALDRRGNLLGWRDRVIIPAWRIIDEPLVDEEPVPAPEIEVIRKRA